MCSITLSKKINYENSQENSYKLSINGLMGGHSGDDIDKNRCNAIKLIIKILKELNCSKIMSVDIGKRDNVIPSEGYITFASEYSLDSLKNKINNMNLDINKDDSNFSYNIEEINKNKTIIESLEIINFIYEVKSGLLEIYQDDGFPLLSSNIGRVSIEDNIVIIKYSIRSSDKYKEELLLNEIQELSKKYGFEFEIDASKPFFPFKEKSNIRGILAKIYKNLYGKETTIKKVHACMEGGILSNNIKDLDICTIAPTIQNCHSVNENVSISSTRRVYEWLKETLIEYNEQ